MNINETEDSKREFLRFIQYGCGLIYQEDMVTFMDKDPIDFANEYLKNDFLDNAQKLFDLFSDFNPKEPNLDKLNSFFENKETRNVLELITNISNEIQKAYSINRNNNNSIDDLELNKAYSYYKNMIFNNYAIVHKDDIENHKLGGSFFDFIEKKGKHEYYALLEPLLMPYVEYEYLKFIQYGYALININEIGNLSEYMKKGHLDEILKEAPNFWENSKRLLSFFENIPFKEYDAYTVINELENKDMLKTIRLISSIFYEIESYYKHDTLFTKSFSKDADKEEYEIYYSYFKKIQQMIASTYFKITSIEEEEKSIENIENFRKIIENNFLKFDRDAIEIIISGIVTKIETIKSAAKLLTEKKDNNGSNNTYGSIITPKSECSILDDQSDIHLLGKISKIKIANLIDSIKSRCSYLDEILKFGGSKKSKYIAKIQHEDSRGNKAQGITFLIGSRNIPHMEGFPNLRKLNESQSDENILDSLAHLFEDLTIYVNPCYEYMRKCEDVPKDNPREFAHYIRNYSIGWYKSAKEKLIKIMHSYNDQLSIKSDEELTDTEIKIKELFNKILEAPKTGNPEEYDVFNDYIGLLEQTKITEEISDELKKMFYQSFSETKSENIKFEPDSKKFEAYFDLINKTNYFKNFCCYKYIIETGINNYFPNLNNTILIKKAEKEKWKKITKEKQRKKFLRSMDATEFRDFFLENIRYIMIKYNQSEYPKFNIFKIFQKTFLLTTIFDNIVSKKESFAICKPKKNIAKADKSTLDNCDTITIHQILGNQLAFIGWQRIEDSLVPRTLLFNAGENPHLLKTNCDLSTITYATSYVSSPAQKIELKDHSGLSKLINKIQTPTPNARITKIYPQPSVHNIRPSKGN